MNIFFTLTVFLFEKYGKKINGFGYGKKNFADLFAQISSKFNHLEKLWRLIDSVGANLRGLFQVCTIFSGLELFFSLKRKIF